MQEKIKGQNNKGFTLVELIIVMAIIAILVGAIAPQVAKYVERARETKDKQLVSTVYTAVQTAINSSDKSVPAISNITLESLLDSANTSIDTKVKADIKSILGTDLDSESKIVGRLVSNKGKNGHIYIEYTSAGKLTVYILPDGETTAAFVDSKMIGVVS